MHALWRRSSKRSIEEKPQKDFIVRLIEPHSREPVTSVERLARSMLQREGAIPFGLLVERVASDLYFEEIRNGASAVDIGLFGSRLFAPEVAGEIKARDGTLWQIEQPERFQ